MSTILGCYIYGYDPKLVVLAAFICIIACFTTVNLLSRAQLANGMRKLIWLSAAGLIFGSGVWSLHFVAMLAFMPGFPISYDPIDTLRSLVVAVSGGFTAFALHDFFKRKPAANIFCGLLLGLSIAGMHYDGVAAMRVGGIVTFHPPMVWLSIFVGVDFALLAIVRAADLSRLRRKIEVSSYIGLGVLGVHFVGMSALTITPGANVVPIGDALGVDSLAVAVGSVGVAIILGGMVGAVTDQRMARHAQRETQRLRQLADASFEGIVIHQDGLIRNANAAFIGMVGRDFEDLVGRSALDFVAKKDLPRVQASIEAHRNGRIEFEFDGPDGLSVPVEVLSRMIDYGGRTVSVSAVRDLSERKRAEEKIRFLAHHDPLTGLSNRLLLNEQLAHMIALSQREGEKLAVLYFDLDRFKPVNDLLGHEGGDMLLVEVARRLRQLLRASDMIARVGGDEFVVVLPIGDDAELAKTLASRIISDLAAPFEIVGEEAVIGASVGIALFPDDGKTAIDLVRNADKAMYRAKNESRGTFRFYTADIDHRLHRIRVMEQELRHAIARNEMEVRYQPIFDPRVRIIGVEALLRWNHPERGVVSPAEFIPVAEESGLICELGAWVLETACAAALNWPETWRIAVNVSPIQFARDGFLDSFIETVSRSGLGPERLELEITENLLIRDSSKVLPILVALKQYGVHISLDDFGTGYSSLNYLHRFPFEKIKIDRSFVAGLGQSEDSEKIVRAIVALGHSLNMTVTAEGVETEGQLRRLRHLECDQLQGFLLGRPLAASEVERLAKKVDSAAPRIVSRARSVNPVSRNLHLVEGSLALC